MKQLFCSIAGLILCVANSRAQDTILQRIILIGDAGEMNRHQEQLLNAASKAIVPAKTKVFFLGDNIYPRGMSLPGAADRKITEDIIRSEYLPLMHKEASVYFIPGNHDWDRSRKNGLARIQEQSAFINNQQNPLLHFIPEQGCPGPVEIPVNEGLVIIAFDSEWWLFQHDKENDSCDCDTKEAFIEALSALENKNKGKTILLMSHHPFQSYGVHGGHYGLMDHIFPLTRLNRNLYLPLPVIGSLYPFLRKAMPNQEDLAHPQYQALTANVDSIFAKDLNLVHIAGHEHGLQLIENKTLQVISGSGSKTTHVDKGKGSLYSSEHNGYVIIDQLADYSLKLRYYNLTNDMQQAVFSYTIPHRVKPKLHELAATSPLARLDSVTVKANAALDHVSRIHRKWYGENYRKEWAADTKLPVIKLSQLQGGLVPVQRGGGFQTKSLRLKDSNGREWVLRNVNKNMELLLPEGLRNTVAKRPLIDAMSAQHPYSALIVPPLANAVGVPHANPVIGVIAPDTLLGDYADDFIYRISLLEEREVSGESDNTAKMFKALKKDNDNTVDTALYFKARLLDLLIGDWDRHEDQWRWAYTKDDNGNKRYTAVPRDRDQVFHVIQGIVPSIAASKLIMPRLHAFDARIKKVNDYFTAGNKINVNLFNQYDHDQWMQLVHEFTATVTDSVLEAGLRRLPEASYRLRHDKLLQQLKERRDRLPAAMSTYYKFLNRIVDIQTSDKNEWVQITGTDNGQLLIAVHKVSKSGNIRNELYHRVFDPAITHEVRLFIHDGNDSVSINNTTSIKLRIVGQKGTKSYEVSDSKRRVRIYGKHKGVIINDTHNRVAEHLSRDSSNTSYMTTNLYNKIVLLPKLGINADDGMLVGLSAQFINQGFRKAPYGNLQEVSFAHSFSSGASYYGLKSEWLHALRKTDIVVKADLYEPNSTQNFFGLGNNTVYDQSKPLTYYRGHFTLLNVVPSFRWRKGTKTSFSVGPFLQVYAYHDKRNSDLLILNPSLVHSYDSSTTTRSKHYTGLVTEFVKDGRNNALLPTAGGFFNIKIQGFKGLDTYSKEFVQATTQMSVYKQLDHTGVFTISDRLGGGVTFGHAPFYQSLFLGGQDNLLGYRKFRFAGTHMLYNNLRFRIKLVEATNAGVPLQVGLEGFFDAGKVWAKGYNSNEIHTGAGGGIYVAPFRLFVLHAVAGYSKEGWLPYITVGFKF